MPQRFDVHQTNEPPYKKRVNKCGFCGDSDHNLSDCPLTKKPPVVISKRMKIVSEKMQSYKAAADKIPETDNVSDNEDALKDDIRSDPNFLSQSVSSATEGDTTIEWIKKKLSQNEENLFAAEREGDISRIEKFESRRDKLESFLLEMTKMEMMKREIELEKSKLELKQSNMELKKSAMDLKKSENMLQYQMREQMKHKNLPLQQIATPIKFNCVCSILYIYRAQFTAPDWTVQLDIQTLCKPKEVPVPVEEDAPPYITEKWLQDTANVIEENFRSKDALRGRVPPMALVRCSRGGKTRALYELSRVLKERLRGDNVAVIYISLNDQTSLIDWESLSPIDAICRRIAFAALPRTKEKQEFAPFAKEVEVSSSAIIQWLGASPRILLIDELNKLEGMTDPGNVEMKRLAEFLKTHFLANDKQYFVFSSHVVSSSYQLSEFMDSASRRRVHIRELPLIANLSMAMNAFDYFLMDTKELLHYGCIPALVYESVLEVLNPSGQQYLPNDNRQIAINKCLQEGVTEEKIELLLKSFLDGSPNSVPPALLQLMDTTSDKRVRWIPYNMVPALREFGSHGPRKYSYLLKSICNCFDRFLDGKIASGSAWENLFLMTLLIRCVSHQFDEVLLPLSDDEYKDSSVSFNDKILNTGETVSSYKNVDKFIRAMKVPGHVPHITVYYPKHAQFEVLDVIVAVYSSSGDRTLYGYQLKESRGPVKALNSSKHDWLREKWFKSIYVVRGLAGSKSSSSAGGEVWITPNEKEIDIFFGVSGQQWTPRRWAELDPTTSKKDLPYKG